MDFKRTAYLQNMLHLYCSLCFEVVDSLKTLIDGHLLDYFDQMLLSFLKLLTHAKNSVNGHSVRSFFTL